MQDTVRKLWESFAQDVMDPDAPPDQLTEMRLAFYAGVAGGMALHKNALKEPGAVDAILAELTAFKDAVVSGT